MQSILLLGCGMINKTCVVSLDSEYLGPGNVDKFDAVVFRIRHFGKDIVSNFRHSIQSGALIVPTISDCQESCTL